MPGTVAQPRYQFVLPGLVDEKLEALRLGALAHGNRASRSDGVAALVWAATVDTDVPPGNPECWFGVTCSPAGAAAVSETSQTMSGATADKSVKPVPSTRSSTGFCATPQHRCVGTDVNVDGSK
jgi:hypothetical protein